MRSSIIALALAALPAAAQTWNSNAGGWNTGYGTVYGSFGVAMATQGMYNTMQLNLQRATMRQAMINKWGLAAVEKAEAEAKRGQPSSAPQGLTVSPPPPAPKNLGAFKPSKSTVPTQLGDALGSTPDEKAAVAMLVSETRKAFEAQPETKAWRNNVAGALAFFIIGNATIATGGEEPSDATSQALFTAISQTLDQSPEFAKASAKDKQQLYEVLIGFTGLPLAIYSEGKERGDEAEVKRAQELAAKLLELVLNVDASQVKLP
ncbi:MAG: hypothetical protein JNJ54_04970 [Myxococcaceae bacterium]|nr:hypothetical protein [Myxococcaceae bacterium]